MDNCVHLCVLSAVYDGQVWMIVLRALLCLYMVCSINIVFACLSWSCLTECVTCTGRSDYMSLSESSQRQQRLSWNFPFPWYIFQRNPGQWRADLPKKPRLVTSRSSKETPASDEQIFQRNPGQWRHRFAFSQWEWIELSASGSESPNFKWLGAHDLPNCQCLLSAVNTGNDLQISSSGSLLMAELCKRHNFMTPCRSYSYLFYDDDVGVAAAEARCE